MTSPEDVRKRVLAGAMSAEAYERREAAGSAGFAHSSELVAAVVDNLRRGWGPSPLRRTPGRLEDAGRVSRVEEPPVDREGLAREIRAVLAEVESPALVAVPA